MLRKLMKHEFRATAKTMLPLFLLLGVAALGARVSIYHLIESGNHWLEFAAVILLMLYTCCGFAVCVMSVVMMVQRFYKNLLQDEGYVMMTLPVSVHQHVWSKLMVSAVWFALTAIVAGLSVMVMAANMEFYDALKEGFRMMFQELTAVYAVRGAVILAEVVILCFLGCCMFCLELYAAMAVGHSRANHKGAWSVAAFVVLSIATNLLNTAGWNFMNFIGLPRQMMKLMYSAAHGDQLIAMHASIWMAILYVVIIGAIYYCITTWFLKHKLNLE